MKQLIKKIVTVFFLLYSLFFVIGSTLSPIFAHLKLYEYSSILTGLYMNACHQQPDRSFWLLGYPVALCCRCYGFYTGVAFSALIILLNKFRLNIKMFSFLLILVVIDVIINIVFKISTGNIIRFFVGIMMGILFISVINYLFDYKKENSNAS